MRPHVAAVGLRVLVDVLSQGVLFKDVGVFREKTEDETREEPARLRRREVIGRANGFVELADGFDRADVYRVFGFVLLDFFVSEKSEFTHALGKVFERKFCRLIVS